MSSRSDLAAFQTPFAQDRAPVATFVEAVKELRPTGIIGVGTAPKLFTHRGDPGHGDDQPAPDHIPYSNPTSRSEFTAEEAYRRRKQAAAGEHGAALGPTIFAVRPYLNQP